MTRTLLQQAFDALHPQANRAFVEATKDALRSALAAPAPAVPPTDTRKLCTCDGAGRGPGRACVVQAGGRLGELWKCAKSAAPAVPLTDADLDRIADAVPVDDIGVHITTWHRRFARAVLSAAPAVPDAVLDSLGMHDAAVKLARRMGYTWEGGEWSAAPAVREPQPLVEIRRRATPCGECHLQPGERCDICGACTIEQARGIGGGGNG